MMSEITGFADVISLWPKTADLARDIGQKESRVQKWKERDSIPPWAWNDVLRSAETRGYAQVTGKLLRDIAERKNHG